MITNVDINDGRYRDMPPVTLPWQDIQDVVDIVEDESKKKSLSVSLFNLKTLYQAFEARQFDGTTDDIWQDIQDLLNRVADTGLKNTLNASLIETKIQFNNYYNDTPNHSAYVSSAFRFMYNFICTFMDALRNPPPHGSQTERVAQYLKKYALSGIEKTSKEPKEIFTQSYYTNPECPITLKLAKLKRIT